ncbi:hypothetical protein [Humisphaera borealis]|uniref:PilZ domain-containing protein n=1 Tax=Humisphaera borealis TaxID=2807512 RepID=A0A7M2WPR6_9BACT|nr:hypothetical protein [Humisphaera borealis]QOV87517.1 hypothetical protein IPV69_14595 [Humisphaera borealis]
MLLPPELFDQVVSALSPARAAVPLTGGGQRQSARVPVATRLTIVPFATGAEGLAGFDFPLDRDGTLRIPLADPVSVPVRDLSRGGIRFMTPRRLALDTPFVVLLPPTTPSMPGVAARPLAIECTVTYWQPVQRDLFAIGAQFLRELKSFRAPATATTILLPGFGGLPATLRPAV